MKKKLFAIILAALMLVSVLALAGCSNDKPGEDPAQKTFKLIVGLDASFPPYGYTEDDGTIVGFDIDLAKEVCKRNNWDFEAKPIDWDSKDNELNQGTINCIWNGFTINGRENDYTWSNPYVDNSQIVVVKADSGIKTLADLAGKVVVTQAGSSAETSITDEENEKMVAFKASLSALKTVKEYNNAFLELDSGAADAVAMDIGVAKYQIESRGADKYVILEELIAAEQYGVGFKLGDTETRDAVQKALDEMKADGTMTKIAEEWKLVDSLVK